MSEMNDVPPYLNELIPYRCPKCGNLRRFATLRELRQHLQADHSFQMGFIKPHSRACVFNRSNDVIGDIGDRSHKSYPDFDRMKRNDKKLNNSMTDFRETSPLLKSFKEETELLEKELRCAIQTEMKHKTASMQSLSGNTINTESHFALNETNNDRHNALNAIHVDQNSNERELASRAYTNGRNTHKPFVEKTKVSPFPHVGDHTMNKTLSSLNSHVMKSRRNQCVTTDALYKSQELLHEMESSAENKCQEQRTIIQQLIHDMKVKDEQIEMSKKRHSDLQNEREKLLHETETLVQETDDYNSKLQHDLNDKHTELDDLNKELTRLRKLSEHELHLKSQDLQQATGRVQCLETERDSLIQETEAILKRADVDNDRLKRQLNEKEAELRVVNESLKQIRSQQEQMLEKTMDVYQNSEDSRELMQTAIRTKDNQLQQAIQQIENMSSLQRRLVEQSRILTDQADDNTASMKRLLRTKAKQMEDLMTQLETLRSEKHHLESNTACLAEKAESSVTAVENLQGMVKQRENDLKATQGELQHLKTFLKSTADKERVARQRLETFIEDLIDRAEKAESELRSLKSQSTNTLNKIGGLNSDSLRNIHQEDSTERKSLPTRLCQVQRNTFDCSESTRLPETFVEDSDTFVETILQKTVSFQSKPFNSEYDESTCSAEELDEQHIHHRNEQYLQDSGGFVIREGLTDHPNCIRENLRLNDDYCRTDDEADGDIESFSLDNSNTINGRQTHKTRRHRSSNHSRMTDSDSKILVQDNSCQPNRKYQFKRHQSKSYQHSGHMRDGNISSENQCSSDTGLHTEDDLGKCNEAAGKQNMVSRGLQVGGFLSLQDAQDEGSDSCSTDSYDESDHQNIEYDNNDIGVKTTYITAGGKRPATIGKSHHHETMAKKKVRHTKKRAVLNDGFDTNYPVVYRSMVDIAGDVRDLSEGEVRHRDRRSRSLSPRIMGAQQFSMIPDIVQMKLNRNRKNKDGHQHEGEVCDDSEYYVDTSINEELSNAINKEGEGHRESDRTDGAFKNIMDENGILWDDDMATLPDVSDSELDRVSPSGSEAISSKRRTTQIDTAITSSHNKDLILSISARSERRQSKRNETVISPSTSTVVHLLNNSTNSDCTNESNYKRKFTPSKSKAHREAVCRKDVRRNTKLQSDKCIGSISDKIFQPITSPTDNKNSISDKDMTSGGREVHCYMRTSPKMDLYHSSETRSLNDTHSINESISKSRSRGMISENESQSSRKIHHGKDFNYKPQPSFLNKERTANNCSIDYKNESVEEKIQRISREYSPRRVKTPPELNCNSTIEDTILSINEKYNKRRHDILRSKGVRTMIEQKHENPSVLNRGGKRTSDRCYDTKMEQSSVRPPNSNFGSENRIPTATINSPFGFSQIPINAHNTASPQPLPFMDFTRMTQHAGFTGPPFGQHDGNFNREALLGSQMPPVFPYLPNYMMYPYAMGAFQQQRSNEHLSEQDELLPHHISTTRNDKNVSPSSNLDQISATHSSVAYTENTSVPKEENQNGDKAGLSDNIRQSKNHQDVKSCDDTVKKIVLDPHISRSDMPEVESAELSIPDVKVPHEHAGVMNSFTPLSINDVVAKSERIERCADETVTETEHEEKEVDTACEELLPLKEHQESSISLNSLTDSFAAINEHTGHISMGTRAHAKHLSLFNDIDNSDSSFNLSKHSVFAEEIDDDTSIGYETNSYLDLPGNITESELDGETDTESVRRDFYEKSQHIKEVLEAAQNDRNAIYSRRTTAVSSASSQASFEIDDKIPFAKREIVKKRRAALVCVFSFLDTRTLTCVARVCREWRIVSRSPKLWRRVELRGEKVSPKFLRRISRRCSQLRVLILENLHPRNRFQTETVEEYQVNMRCSLENGYEQILKKSESTIHTIVIINCGQLLSAKCLWIASCCCRMLKHVTYLSDFDPINAEVMWALGSGCRELKTLKCQPLLPCARENNFTSRCSLMIGQCFKEMETLSLGGMIVDVSSLAFIAKQCQKLTRIEIHHMLFISCDVIDDMCQNGLHDLKRFSLLSTPIAPGALTLLEAHCKRLDHVYIRLTEADFRSCKQVLNAPAIPEYHEVIDGYEVLKKQPTFIKKLALDVESPSELHRTETIEEPEKEPSFFDRWFK